MARQLKLVRLDDFISDIDSIDLFAGGYSLAEDGYTPVVAPLGATSVHEVITLKIQGSSKDNLATLIQALDAKIKQVQWWIDDPGIERYQVWLRVQQDNETYARQAQILNVLPPEKVRVFQPEEYNNNYIGEYSIGIERTPYWEAPYPYPSTTTVTAISCLGGAANLSETINGDVPARLAKAIVTPTTAHIFGNFWLGWKTSRFGVRDNFVSNWALSLGAANNDTSGVSDSTANSGTSMNCTFATVPTLVQRVFIKVGNVTANYADQRGSYNVLLRAKMSDTSIARAQIRYGFGGPAGLFNPVFNSRQTISGTDWSIYDMGTVRIPSSPVLPSFDLRNCAIEACAERISGSGELHMDCLILIPRDDSSIKITVSSDISSDSNLDVYEKADGSINVHTDMSGLVAYPAVAHPVNWGLPANAETPRLIFAATGLTHASVKTNTANIVYAYIPRWRTLRGNVT